MKHDDVDRAAETIQDAQGPSGSSGLRLVPGDAIGPFRVIELLGEGGFGAVYLCQQTEPVKRRVAIKIIKPGMDSSSIIARFEAERQALALMNHVAIAKVFDAGATLQGRPYFVMEYVKGVSITEYCDRDRLDTAARLALFAKVCDGVQHAHQKGIIHRDLKPGNILVSIDDREEPHPKIIDFGIAKATGQQLTDKSIHTNVGQMIGTPEYMSPEQAEMSSQDIDTRSDVYSLGVVLYELLSGRLPFEPEVLRAKGYAEIQRIIREEDPPKPSARLTTLNGENGGVGSTIASARQTTVQSLSQALRSELDWIPLRALRKDRAERYPSAEALGADVRRYLRGEALEAGPESLVYRVRKVVKRHKGFVAAAVLIALSLVAGVIGTSINAIDARREHALAEERLGHLRLLVSKMVGPITDSLKNLEGGMEARRQMLNAGMAQLEVMRTEAHASNDPRLLDAIGSTLVSYGDLIGGPRTASVGDRAEANSYYQEAIEVYGSIAPAALTAETRIMQPWILNRQADLAMLDGDAIRASELIEEAQTLLEPITENGNASVQRLYLATFERLCDMALARGDHEAALVHAEAHQQGIERLLVRSDAKDPKLRRDLAMTLRRTGFARSQLGGDGTRDLRTSRTILVALSAESPADLRRQRDVGWASLYVAQDVVKEDRGHAEATQLFKTGAVNIVAVCAAEPTVAEYRNDVVTIVRGVCEALVSIGRVAEAAVVRENALLVLQPIVEAQPENIALARVLTDLVAIRVESP